MPFVKCRFCGKEKRISLGMNLLPAEINGLHLCCQPSCFKMYHSRGTFTDLNKKDALVSQEEIFRDMDLQYQVAVNDDVAAKHRAENLRKRSLTQSYDNKSSDHRAEWIRPRNQSVDQPLPSLRASSADMQQNSTSNGSNTAPASALPAFRPPVDNSAKIPSIMADKRPSEAKSTASSDVFLPPINYSSREEAAVDDTNHNAPPPAQNYAQQPWTQTDYVRSMDRFRSTRYGELDDRNNVFRVDLTPAFQNAVSMSDIEVDFLFRCIESVESLVVIQGLACRLMPLYWTIPFLLTTLPANIQITCDQFRWDRTTGSMLFVAEHHVPLAQVKAFFLSGSSVQLTNARQQSMSVVPPEDGLALRDISLEFHARVLANNLKQDFAWDLFAGGLHCWMQYMPAQYRDAARFDPKIHLCGSGQRSELIYAGNGSTDVAYQVVLGEMELIVFDQLSPPQCQRVQDFLKRMGYTSNTRTDLHDKYLHNLKHAPRKLPRKISCAFGRLHMWRSVMNDKPTEMYPTLMLLSWEWLFQGVTPARMAESMQYSMTLVRTSTPPPPMPRGFVFNPRNYIVEAVRQWIALSNLEKFYDKCVLRLRALCPLLEMILEEEQAIQNEGDDSWFIGENHITRQILHTLEPVMTPEAARCSMCQNELSNSFKQCLGCSVFGMKAPFAICMDCFRHPDKQFDSQPGLRSLRGHTGCLEHSQAYKESPTTTAAKCACAAVVRCSVCDGCDQCCCFCHTMFQTRYRIARPDELVQLYHVVVSRTSKDARRH
ncbi:unnamed protein product [Aphanomyces euteiches]